MGKSTYKPEYCTMLLKHMSDGYSFASFGAIVHCGAQTLYDWIAKHEDFKDAREEGQAKALYWFEQFLRAGLTGAKIEVNNQKVKIDKILLIFSLKTRFHKIYGEKHREDQEDRGITIHIDKDDDGL